MQITHITRRHAGEPVLARRALVAAVLLILSLLAIPAGASASSFCVADASCVAAGGADEASDLQKALDDAKANAGLDRVQVGGGTLAAGPYTYLDGSAANGVEIVGAGTDTKLTAPSGTTALTVAGGVSRVSTLAIETAGVNGRGLVFQGPSQADHLTVTGTTTGTTGVAMLGGSLTDSTVTLPLGSLDYAVLSSAKPTSSTVLADDVLTGTRAFEGNSSGGSVTLRRIKAMGTQTLMLHCGSMTVEDSVIDTTTAASAQAVTVGTSTSCPTTASVRHSTVVGHAGVNSVGVWSFAGGTGATNLDVRDSIVTGFAHALRRHGASGLANLTTEFSDYDPAGTVDINGTGSGSITESDRLTVDPALVDPAGGDFRLRDDSPLVDAGDPAGLAAGESVTDLAGNPRLVDGLGLGTARSDLGAFEHPVGATGPTPTPTPTPPPGGEETTPPAPAGDPAPSDVATTAEPAPNTTPTDAPEPAVPTPGVPAARLRLAVTPGTVTAGRTVRLRFAVKRGRRPVAGARVRVGRRTVRTDRRGRATLRVRFLRPGRQVARASAPGSKPATVAVHVGR